MKQKQIHNELQQFLLLWSSQSFSALGSSMTSFALIIWAYQQTGSALGTALLSICTYAPYVMFSLFAGSFCDRWNKKYIMLICDGIAAVTTIMIWILLAEDSLLPWHLYVLNAANGVMNALQQPASDVTISLLTPKHLYQKASSLRSFSNSLNTIVTPVIATALYTLAGMQIIILFDLITFFIAEVTLLFLIHIPEVSKKEEKEESILQATRSGLSYLWHHQGILQLILFLSMINLCASLYNAALPAMMLSRSGGNANALGIVEASSGLANLAGSIYLLFVKAPKSRVRVICNTLLFSMCTENFFLAFGNSIPIWCLGAILGWIVIPVMNTNMDVIFRSYIPVSMQGRVYAARNTLQFFTIPVGYLLGGILVDLVCEPLMKLQDSESLFVQLFGQGKGSGAALLFCMLGVVGTLICLIFRRSKAIWQLEDHPS